MSLHGGLLSAINGIKSVRKWNIEDQQDINEIHASNTHGGRVVKKGVQDWTGSYEQYGAIPLNQMPGDIISFIGYESPDDDVSGVGQAYEGNAMVDSIQIAWNWSTLEPLMTVVNFSGHGALTVDAAQAQVEDVTDPDIICPSDCKVEYGPSGYEVEWDNLVSATLNIQRANVAYANSSTDGWRERKKGPFSYSLTFVEEDVDRTRFAKGDYVEFKLYTDATDYWWLQWGFIQSFTGIVVDRSTGAIIQQTVNVPGSIRNLSTTGSITLPGESTAWAGNDPA